MRLKLLALSDTHLGEDDSLLSYPTARRELWRVLRRTFSNLEGDNWQDSDPFEVDELVLIGDIPDRTLSSTSEIMVHVNAFIEMLASAAAIKKCVYIPGNHDHTLWSSYCDRHDREQALRCTPPEGELLVDRGTRLPSNDPGDEYLETLFGYPDGSSWRRIDAPQPSGERLEFRVANPLYATRVGDRTYAFAHGTHFRGKSDVAMAVWLKRLGHHLWVDWMLFGARVNPNCDPTKPRTLEEFEEAVAGFADTAWRSAGNNPERKADRAYYLLRTLSWTFGSGRPSPEESRLYYREDLPATPLETIQHLTPEGGPVTDSLVRCQRRFLPCLLDFLQAHDFGTEKLTFVYGDTHQGGWGELPGVGEEPIRVYNTGGWVTDAPSAHPSCHLFAVDEDDRECLLDVSFRDISVGQDNLLEVAAKAAEYHHMGSGGRLHIVAGGLDRLLRGLRKRKQRILARTAGIAAHPSEAVRHR